MPTIDRSIYVNRRLAGFRQRYTTNSTIKVGFTGRLVRTRTGVSNPNYKQQIRDQQNAGTPLTGTFETLNLDVVDAEVLFKDHAFPQDQTIFRNWVRGNVAAYHYIPSPNDWIIASSTSVANNRALINYLKNVRQAQVQFSAPTFIGEFRQAVSMIRHPAQGLRNLIDSYLSRVKKRKNAKPKSWKKDLGSMWLEYAFGWTPLISDINNAYKTYRGLSDERAQQPCAGYGSDEKFNSARSASSTPVDIGPTVVYYIGSRKCYDKIEVRYKGMVFRLVEAPRTEHFMRFGFEPTEFVPTAWELLPWSFLVDYFTNIGDVITANCAVRSRIAWTNKSIIKLRVSEAACGYDEKLTKAIWPRHVSSSGGSSTAKLVTRDVTREPNAVLGTPDLAVEIPGRPAQWTNMLALFAQISSSVHPQRMR